MGTARRTILRIEIWHGVLLLGLLATLGQTKMIEPAALLIGGLFMGLNFFLLSFGVAEVLTPLAGRGKVKLGIALLVLKVAISAAPGMAEGFGVALVALVDQPVIALKSVLVPSQYKD